MKRIILILFCLLAFPVVASHIVGGEFEIVHISGNTYRINLILYFDQLNGNPGAKDLNVTARIFRKRDNSVMMNVFLPLTKEEPVTYTQPACSKGEIVTTKLTYSTTVQLTPQQYSDALGYYLSWERCCRNYTITNIYSQDPNGNNGGQYAGQTFYLEFPAVVKDGQPFINSSPRLFPPLNDYACPRKPYYVDFGGTDDDGDSLVYSLVTPLNTRSADALPPGNQLPRPRPYPNVTWRPGYGLSNVLGGSPDLRISDDGFLTVTPTIQGLFVFAVRCEEYRNGEKIGEVRRDFQMLVVDVCPRAEPPQILGKKLGDSNFAYDGNMNVTFSNTVGNSNRCIQVQVSDPDASNQDDNFQEKIKIRAIALNFKKDVSGILPAITSATLLNGSTKTFDICFDACPPFEGGPFQVGIVAYDDACSLPLTDTLKITVNIEPPINHNPYFTTPNITETVKEGDFKTWPIQGLDLDNDQLIVGVLTDGFSFEKYGMNLRQLQLDKGLYKAQLEWNTRCDIYDFTHKTNFEIKILLEDIDDCSFRHPDTMVFKLNIILPGNSDPIIGTDLTAAQVKNGINKNIFDKIEFNVFGADADKDLLVLGATGKGFDLSTYNISFPQVTGNSFVTSHFKWDIPCDKVDLKKKDQFEFQFIVVDNANKCRYYKADTLTVKVKVSPPDNDKPTLKIYNTNPALTFEDNKQSLIVGQQISLALTASDGNRVPAPDEVSIELIDAHGNVEPHGYVFAPAHGSGAAETTFTWNTDCTLFEEGVYVNNYTFAFRSVDNRCFNPKADTVQVDFTIKDVESSEKEFLPINIITPNGDGCNDFFAMDGLDELALKCGDTHLPHLPKDNCIGRFSRIFVYNRWGEKIFESDKRDFRWYPAQEAMGVYYYTLQYTNKEYKGTITLKN
jgi:hypothetical protein